jgi:hypothetical protein
MSLTILFLIFRRLRAQAGDTASLERLLRARMLLIKSRMLKQEIAAFTRMCP